MGFSNGNMSALINFPGTSQEEGEKKQRKKTRRKNIKYTVTVGTELYTCDENGNESITVFKM